MTYKPCPDCTTGWCYSDELPDWHTHPGKPTLVKCPTCEGSGRIIDPDDHHLALQEHDFTEPRTYDLPPTLIRYDF